jgi:hypothetical protein
MSGLAWFDDLPDATLALAIDDDVVHRVTWRRGKLILEDHDFAAEQALVALGGERCECLDVADLFSSPPPLHDIVQATPSRRADSGRPIRSVLPSRQSYVTQLARQLPPAVAARMRVEFSEQTKRQHRLGVLRTIDGDLRRRLLAASSVAAARRGIGGYADDWIGVQRFYANEIGPAVEWSLRGSRRNLPAGVKVDFHLRVIDDAVAPAVEGVVSRGGGSVHLALQPRWLADVWAHDLTLVDNHPVVAVNERMSADSAWVTVICWSRARFELTEPHLESMLICRDEIGFWHSAADQRSG